MPRSGLSSAASENILRRIGQAERDHTACRRPQRLRMRALFDAPRQPAHVAVVTGSEKIRQPAARLGPEFGATEADCIEAERQRTAADQARGAWRIIRVVRQLPAHGCVGQLDLQVDRWLRNCAVAGAAQANPTMARRA